MKYTDNKIELYSQLEEHIISTLKSKLSNFPIETYPNILKYFRILDLDTRLLIYLKERDLLVYTILNIIHYNKLNKYPITSKNKILDLSILFDFSSNEKYFTEKYWKAINKNFQKYMRYKKYDNNL